MFRQRTGVLEVFLVHPGGPYFRNKDEGAWTIPKGQIEPGEEPIDAACREFVEETGLTSQGPYLPLTPVRQKGGKTVMGWAFRGDVADPITIRPNRFTLEWPPRSGRMREFPEIDFVGSRRVHHLPDALADGAGAVAHLGAAKRQGRSQCEDGKAQALHPSHSSPSQ